MWRENIMNLKVRVVVGQQGAKHENDGVYVILRFVKE